MTGGRAGSGSGGRALVTGGAGFIGHHLVGALLDAGMDVTVLDNLSMGRRANVPDGVRFIEGDVRDPGAVEAALEGVDVVFHEAAVVSVRVSMDQFLEDAHVNLMGTLNLLRCMETAAVRKAVFASSMAVYADSPVGAALRENSPTEPISPYGIAKLASEKYWLLMCPHFGIEGTVLRYFNTYGPGQTLTPYVGVMTIFTDRLLSGDRPVIFGDGEQCRDFIHVADVVAANLAVLRADAAGRIFNVGTGRGTSVNEIARGLMKVLAAQEEPEYAAAKPGEMRNAVADIGAIQSALDFKISRPLVDFGEVVAYRKAKAAAQ